jgi:hypothetical protein
MGSASSSQSWEQIVAQQQQQLNQMMISNQALLQQNLQMQENYLSHSRATPGADRTANNEISRGLQETLQVNSLVKHTSEYLRMAGIAEQCREPGARSGTAAGDDRGDFKSDAVAAPLTTWT